MTVLRRDPAGISNYFDRVFAGIGHRGSSFTDIDGLVHDGRTSRFLMLEFKERSEPVVSNGQGRVIVSFSCLPGCESWLLRRLDGNRNAVSVCQRGKVAFRQDIDEGELQVMLKSWWAGATVFPPVPGRGRDEVGRGHCATYAECDNDPAWHCRVCWIHLSDPYTNTCSPHGGAP